MYITQQSQLESFCDKISDSEVIAVDTEFKRETTYYPELCLIQIANKDDFGIIDALSIKDLSSINKLFQNKSIRKVLHSGSQDLEIFYHEFGELPKNIYDTQIAACVTGLRTQISFKDLITHYLNINLDKSETRSDWTKRPLTKKQLIYAEQDVVFLMKCYPIIEKHLVKLERQHWLAGDFAELENISKFHVDKSLLWKKVKGHQNLNKFQLNWLNKLAIWREYIATQKNLPRKRAIKDLCLLQAAQIDSKSTEQIQCLQSFFKHKAFKEKLASIIEENPPCLMKAFHAIKLNHEEKVLFDQCLELLNKRSQTLGIELKNHISNSKIKELIKVPTASTISKTNNLKTWKDFAIYKALNSLLNN